MVYWYSRQEMFMGYGNYCSTKFRVTNGVKQGGILSPVLFNNNNNNNKKKNLYSYSKYTNINYNSLYTTR